MDINLERIQRESREKWNKKSSKEFTLSTGAQKFSGKRGREKVASGEFVQLLSTSFCRCLVREHSPRSYSSSEISQPSEISAPDDGQAENLCVNSLEGHVLANSGLTRPSAAIISGTGSQTISW